MGRDRTRSEMFTICKSAQVTKNHGYLLQYKPNLSRHVAYIIIIVINIIVFLNTQYIYIYNMQSTVKKKTKL